MCSSPPSTGPKGIGGRIAKYRTVHPLRHISGPLGVIITYFIFSYCVRFDLPTEEVQTWQRHCQPWNIWPAQTRTMQSSAVTSRPLREDVYDTSGYQYATFSSYMCLAKKAASMQSKRVASDGYLMEPLKQMVSLGPVCMPRHCKGYSLQKGSAAGPEVLAGGRWCRRLLWRALCTVHGDSSSKLRSGMYYGLSRRLVNKHCGRGNYMDNRGSSALSTSCCVYAERSQAWALCMPYSMRAPRHGMWDERCHPVRLDGNSGQGWRPAFANIYVPALQQDTTPPSTSTKHGEDPSLTSFSWFHWARRQWGSTKSLSGRSYTLRDLRSNAYFQSTRSRENRAEDRSPGSGKRRDGPQKCVRTTWSHFIGTACETASRDYGGQGENYAPIWAYQKEPRSNGCTRPQFTAWTSSQRGLRSYAVVWAGVQSGAVRKENCKVVAPSHVTVAPRSEQERVLHRYCWCCCPYATGYASRCITLDIARETHFMTGVASCSVSMYTIAGGLVHSQIGWRACHSTSWILCTPLPSMVVYIACSLRLRVVLTFWLLTVPCWSYGQETTKNSNISVHVVGGHVPYGQFSVPDAIKFMFSTFDPWSWQGTLLVHSIIGPQGCLGASCAKWPTISAFLKAPGKTTISSGAAGANAGYGHYSHTGINLKSVLNHFGL